MKKVDIKQKDFNSLVLEVLQAYQNYDDCDVEESIKAALKEKVFNIKKEFEENSWNDCDVEAPDKYQYDDLIIRRKASVTRASSSTEHTQSCDAYYIGYYVPETNPHFKGKKGLQLLDNENLSEYEYKFIQ